MAAPPISKGAAYDAIASVLNRLPGKADRLSIVKMLLAEYDTMAVSNFTALNLGRGAATASIGGGPPQRQQPKVSGVTYSITQREEISRLRSLCDSAMAALKRTVIGSPENAAAKAAFDTAVSAVKSYKDSVNPKRGRAAGIPAIKEAEPAPMVAADGGAAAPSPGAREEH